MTTTGTLSRNSRPEQLFGNPVQQDGGADADNDAGDHPGDDQDGHVVDQLGPGNGKHCHSQLSQIVEHTAGGADADDREQVGLLQKIHDEKAGKAAGE